MLNAQLLVTAAAVRHRVVFRVLSASQNRKEPDSRTPKFPYVVGGGDNGSMFGSSACRKAEWQEYSQEVQHESGVADVIRTMSPRRCVRRQSRPSLAIGLLDMSVGVQDAAHARAQGRSINTGLENQHGGSEGGKHGRPYGDTARLSTESCLAYIDMARRRGEQNAYYKGFISVI